MKIRNGFVSNSSSGSFIMHWRVKTYGKDVSVTNAVGRIFNASFKQDSDEISWFDTWNKEMKPVVEEIIRATMKNNDGSFTTSFWTSMVNSPEDFGEAAKSLVMGIVASEDYELIDSKIEMDH